MLPLIIPEQGWETAPALIDEVDIDTAYMGFVATGQNIDHLDYTNGVKCAILKIEKTGTVTTYTWAEGSVTRDKIWNSRTTYDYKLLGS